MANQPKRWRPMWKLRKDASGEMQFLPIVDKGREATRPGGTIYSTVTSSVMKSPETAKQLSAAIAAAGGAVSNRSGRMISVSVSGSNIEAVGDAIESFGCPWDFERDT